MRFSSALSAIVIALLAACQGAAAQQPTSWPQGQQGQHGPPGDATPSEWSTMTTYYTTRTVLRVVETVYATKNSSTFASTTTYMSVAPTPLANGTSVVLGTSAGPHASSTSGSPAQQTSVEGAASHMGASLGVVAIAGLAGLLAL